MPSCMHAANTGASDGRRDYPATCTQVRTLQSQLLITSLSIRSPCWALHSLPHGMPFPRAKKRSRCSLVHSRLHSGPHTVIQGTPMASSQCTRQDGFIPIQPVGRMFSGLLYVRRPCTCRSGRGHTNPPTNTQPSSCRACSHFKKLKCPREITRQH